MYFYIIEGGTHDSYDKDVYCSETYYSHAPGKIVLENLPVSGNYHLYVQAKPIASGYDNCDMVSATFEIEVPNTTYYEFSAGNVIADVKPWDQLSDDFTELLDSITTDAYIKISGTTNAHYSYLFYAVGSYVKDNFQYLIDLDFSGMTTTSGKDLSNGCEFQNCTQLRSINLPDVLIGTYDCSFDGCSNLEKVVFGSDFSQILGDKGFQDCTE